MNKYDLADFAFIYKYKILQLSVGQPKNLYKSTYILICIQHRNDTSGITGRFRRSLIVLQNVGRFAPLTTARNSLWLDEPAERIIAAL